MFPTLFDQSKGVRIMAGASENVESDLGLSDCFRRVFSTTYNWEVTTEPQYGRKIDVNRNSKSRPK